ncbi:18710_t:CDS:2, partial [Entrophospora sp. SA101]
MIKKTWRIQDETNDTYQAWCDDPDEDTDFMCTAILNPEPLQCKLLLESVNKLSSKSPKHWNDDDVMPIVKLLAGQPFIDGTGENYEGA